MYCIRVSKDTFAEHMQCSCHCNHRLVRKQEYSVNENLKANIQDFPTKKLVNWR